MVSMLWCMKDFQRHAAQLLEYLAFFTGCFISECQMDGWKVGKAGMIFDYGCARAKRTSEIRD